jgi:hypothetical protein
MRWKLASGLVLACVVLSAASVCAAQPLLSLMGVKGQDGYLCLDFYLKNAFEKDLLSSIKNGVPALLVYQVRIWEDRANWYDKLVKSMTYSYKIAFDNWDTVYCVDAVAEERQNTGRAHTKADLVDMLCSHDGFKTCPLAELNTTATYYVTISAAIQSLSAERVREIESWLGGQTGDAKQQAGGGLLGFMVDLFSSNAQRAETKSNLFSLEALSR